ncbi:Hsp20/alpha crystallin family protein [Rivibacter subsaxonicus]|uniref:Heat shock protein Hsp20 n=1 Tax=Rivibacter subsaxonicus TaxID=457575 RepID=A0A4Q7VD85_9BURK|nr:Hsp20/alpha crystallin family protein [Rivibacter subsaxonicus]RZT93660.1 heat shock protein Hsp20 [Rivibacter subsaxonicus]
MFVMPVTRSHRAASLGDFNRAVDRLFDSGFDRFLDGVRTGAPRLPAVDLVETEAGYTLSAELPGVAKEDIKVSIIGKRVSIEAAVKAAPKSESAESTEPAQVASRVLLTERGTARFERRFSLPRELDEQASSARFDNGVLVLDLVKKALPGATELSIG